MKISIKKKSIKPLKRKISPIIEYFNNHITDSDKMVCEWITLYFHTSHSYETTKMDGVWFKYQPSWPDKTVISYQPWSDNAFSYGHKTKRLMCIFEDNTEFDISIYKFKRFLRHNITELYG